MPSISFEQLVRLYQSTAFNGAGDRGTIHVAAQDVLDCVLMLESDETAAAQDADITILDDVSSIKIGAVVRARIGKPKLSLGRLARDLNELLDGPEARIAEPAGYFVIDGQLTRDAPAAGPIGLYRKLLSIIAILSEAASYLDRMNQELLFFREVKLILPIVYDAAIVDQLADEEADKFIQTFVDQTNRDQKLEILADSVDNICRAQTGSTRFAYLIRNLDELNRMVADG